MLALGLLTLGGGACSGNTDGGGRAPGQSTGGAGDNPGSGGMSVALTHGGMQGVGFGGAGPTAGNAAVAGNSCAATTTAAKLIPLDLYVLMDSSKSMQEPTTTNGTKWAAVSGALTSFFQDANSQSLSVALKYFPDETPGVAATCMADGECGASGPCQQRKACVTKGTSSTQITMLCSVDADCVADGPNEVCVPVKACTTSGAANCVDSAPGACAADCKQYDGYCENRDVCSSDAYAAPAVAFGELPGAAAALTASLSARTPDGFTPTGPALTGAMKAAQARATAKPDHKVVVVLVTDGLPGGYIPGSPPPTCTPADIPGVAGIAATGEKGTPPIQTFVIGVFGPKDLVDKNVMPQANLDALAMSGGTNKAVVISTDQNVTQQLQDALKLVRTAAIACQYAIPQSDTTLDFDKVNVNFSPDATSPSQIIYYVGGSDDSKCDPVNGGWHYDHDPHPPESGKPTQVIACPQNCTKFQANPNAHVDIALGCKTEVPR